MTFLVFFNLVVFSCHLFSQQQLAFGELLCAFFGPRSPQTYLHKELIYNSGSMTPSTNGYLLATSLCGVIM